jgi:FixJ family two-component response regulator
LLLGTRRWTNRPPTPFPFEVALEVRDDAANWTWRDLTDRKIAEVKRLSSEGHSNREIANTMGIKDWEKISDFHRSEVPLRHQPPEILWPHTS